MNERQEKFAEEYLVDLNATQAAIRAGYSENGAGQKGHELLKNSEISAFIQERRLELRSIIHVTQEMIVTELALLGFSNMLNYMGVGEDGLPFPDFSGLTKDQAAALSSVTTEVYYEQQGETTVPVKRIRFKLADKKSALVELNKILGFDPPKRISITVDGAVRHTVEELRARAKQIAEGVIEAEVVE